MIDAFILSAFMRNGIRWVVLCSLCFNSLSVMFFADPFGLSLNFAEKLKHCSGSLYQQFLGSYNIPNSRRSALLLKKMLSRLHSSVLVMLKLLELLEAIPYCIIFFCTDVKALRYHSNNKLQLACSV